MLYSSPKITNNRIGYFILTIGVSLGLYFSWDSNNKTEKIASQNSVLIEQQERFIIEQCKRDKLKDQVIVGALEDAKRRAIESLSDKPDKRDQAVAAIQKSIDGIKNSPPCVLPKVN